MKVNIYGKVSKIRNSPSCTERELTALMMGQDVTLLSSMLQSESQNMVLLKCQLRVGRKTVLLLQCCTDGLDLAAKFDRVAHRR
jgi:hypothetical protein